MKIENGETFPTLSADAVEGTTLTVPDDVEGAWSALLFYRGHW